MNTDVSNSFESHFGILSDPRIDRTKLYPLTEILFVVLTGSICGAESWRDFVLFGKEKLDFIRRYYPFENEITAIPKLLDLLDLKGQIITIDAMGTQKAIAKQIHDKEGHYVLALKGNQGTLNEDVRLFLETEFKKNSSTRIDDRYEEADKGHGRIEMRRCIMLD